MNSDAVSLVRQLYEAFSRADMPAVLGVMDRRIEWREAEGLEYASGNPYVGPDAVLQGVFGRLANEWDNFTVTPRELLATADGVVALGRYTATHKATSRPLDAQFAHVWQVQDGKIRAFQQYTDTAQFVAAMRA